jgi:hypothetical protein|tara:strand:- start:1297 stop:1917 length:621 start_codon:yes stop_codon:yes gene_type:complete
MTLALSILYPYQITGQIIVNSYLTWGLSKNMSMNISRNFVSALHASGAVALAGIALYSGFDKYALNAARIWSSGYFIYDSIFMLKYDKYSLMRSSYLYHHLVSTYLIQLDPVKYYGMHAIFWGELSNLPSYVVYHYLKTNPDHPNLSMYKSLQKYMYGFIRLPIIGYYLTKSYYGIESANRGPVKSIIPIYLMGIIWSIKLFLQKN